MSNTPASPGDPLFPKLTASWYNNTLPENASKGRKGKRIILPREGEILCVAEDEISRFDAVGVTELKDTDTLTYQRTPAVSKADVDQHNWVVAQEGGVAGGPVLCVVFGLTRAWVATHDVDDNCVVFDPDSGALTTAKEGKAQILVKGGSSFPSLINIGVQPNVIRVVGTLASAMPATEANYTVQNLKGVNFTAEELSSSIAARNVHEFEADAGALVRAEWVYDNNRWEIYQVTCPE